MLKNAIYLTLGLASGALFGIVLKGAPVLLFLSVFIGLVFLWILVAMSSVAITFILIRGAIRGSVVKLLAKAFAASLLSAVAIIAFVFALFVLSPTDFAQLSTEKLKAYFDNQSSLWILSGLGNMNMLSFPILSKLAVNRIRPNAEDLEKITSLLSRMIFQINGIILKVLPYGLCFLMLQSVAERAMTLKPLILVTSTLWLFLLPSMLYLFLLSSFESRKENKL